MTIVLLLLMLVVAPHITAPGGVPSSGEATPLLYKAPLVWATPPGLVPPASAPAPAVQGARHAGPHRVLTEVHIHTATSRA